MNLFAESKIENRLNNILVKDKFENSEYVCSVLKGEVEAIAKNYFILNDDVIVRVRKNYDSYTFNIEINADRIKPFGYLPRD